MDRVQPSSSYCKESLQKASHHCRQGKVQQMTQGSEAGLPAEIAADSQGQGRLPSRGN